MRRSAQRSLSVPCLPQGLEAAGMRFGKGALSRGCPGEGSSGRAQEWLQSAVGTGHALPTQPCHIPCAVLACRALACARLCSLQPCASEATSHTIPSPQGPQAPLLIAYRTCCWARGELSRLQTWASARWARVGPPAQLLPKAAGCVPCSRVVQLSFPPPARPIPVVPRLLRGECASMRQGYSAALRLHALCCACACARALSLLVPGGGKWSGAVLCQKGRPAPACPSPMGEGASAASAATCCSPQLAYCWAPLLLSLPAARPPARRSWRTSLPACR